MQKKLLSNKHEYIEYLNKVVYLFSYLLLADNCYSILVIGISAKFHIDVILVVFLRDRIITMCCITLEMSTTYTERVCLTQLCVAHTIQFVQHSSIKVS